MGFPLISCGVSPLRVLCKRGCSLFAVTAVPASIGPLVHDSIERHQPRDHCSLLPPLPRTFHGRVRRASPGAQPRTSATISALEATVWSSSTLSSQRAALALQKQQQLAAGSLGHFGQASAERRGTAVCISLFDLFSSLLAETAGRSVKSCAVYCCLLFFVLTSRLNSYSCQVRREREASTRYSAYHVPAHHVSLLNKNRTQPAIRCSFTSILSRAFCTRSMIPGTC